MKTLVKHDFWCGFPNMFQTFIQRLRSTRSPPLSAPDQPRSVPGGSMVASTANRLPEPSLFHGLERAPHDVRALCHQLFRDLDGRGPYGWTLAKP